MPGQTPDTHARSWSHIAKPRDTLFVEGRNRGTHNFGCDGDTHSWNTGDIPRETHERGENQGHTICRGAPPLGREHGGHTMRTGMRDLGGSPSPEPRGLTLCAFRGHTNWPPAREMGARDGDTAFVAGGNWGGWLGGLAHRGARHPGLGKTGGAHYREVARETWGRYLGDSHSGPGPPVSRDRALSRSIESLVFVARAE